MQLGTTGIRKAAIVATLTLCASGGIGAMEFIGASAASAHPPVNCVDDPEPDNPCYGSGDEGGDPPVVLNGFQLVQRNAVDSWGNVEDIWDPILSGGSYADLTIPMGYLYCETRGTSHRVDCYYQTPWFGTP